MKWMGERISFIDNKNQTTVVIYPPNIGIRKLFLLLWTLAWLAIGTFVFSQFFVIPGPTEKEKIILIVFLSFWFYYAIRVSKTLIYLYWGREYMKLDQEGFSLKIATGRYGKSNRFFYENIKSLKVVSMKETSFQHVYESSPWIKGSNRLFFDYMGKTISFGRKLKEEDAQLLYKFLVKKITQKSK